MQNQRDERRARLQVRLFHLADRMEIEALEGLVELATGLPMSVDDGADDGEHGLPRPGAHDVEGPQ